MSVPSLFARSIARSVRPVTHSIFGTAKRPTIFSMAQSKRENSSNAPSGFKEDHSKGAMLRFEDSLPQLPVPKLEDTAKKYLKTIRPLVNKAEYEHTEKAVNEFIKPGGQGEVLQKRLNERAEDPNVQNWLSEWWNDAAYLGVRDPVVPFVSYFYAHRDDRNRRNPAKRAASIVTAVLEFKRQVDEGSLEPEYMRKEPIAMSSYEWMFNACRRPAKPSDYSVKYSYKEHPYFIVVRKNQFFKVDHEIDGAQLTTPELELQFNRVYEGAEKSPPVGALTADNRDRWTDTRENLMNASPSNKKALEMIEASSFLVCLDDAKPVTLEERARNFWHGDGCNRFYDKPCQFMICDNGVSGFQGEHSMMDGTPTFYLNDVILGWVHNNKVDLSGTSVRSNLPDPQPINFVTNETVEKDIATARTFHQQIVAEHDLSVEAFQGYGKNQIKKFKSSPDSYVQMIIQLAYHKMYGKNRPTYESAATRAFQLGRTETCRTVSDESVAWCDAMANPKISNEKRVELFYAAIKAHGKYIGEAAQGYGVDRHLFGLQKLLKEDEPVPEIFKDPVYTYSQSWFVSSSQLSSEFFNGYGWSEVIPEGWGIAYMVNGDSLNFNLVSKRLGNERMAYFINEAACDMRDLLLPTVQEKSKL